ncbi:uncharacterized protein LOC115230976 [Octopus sinensis]|uniref:Uncharacterized protein LOC115230972 n=1 Tax=Octopus sinensis TaxID=2607531 RepID=A0A6P7TWZ1_9MOLL|nr:uncharacterized protein LOC115230972 [Octopus sinensis]XP_029656936.1 uncharacterized protein LOC115230976 [Octopus sinensis]
MLSGTLPETIRHVMFSAKLIAFDKKGGGVRPIAVGLVFRRLASKLVCRAILPTLITQLQPAQIGVGSPGGCEAAVHAVRTFTEKNEDTPFVIVKIDIKNAFNSIRRDTILEDCLTHYPSVYSYINSIHSSYRKPSSLVHGQYHIPLCSGVQQGDPLGPALFSLGIARVTKYCSTPLRVWYLDDCTMGGQPKDVLDCLKSLIAQLESLCVTLNTIKCEVTNFGFSQPKWDLILETFREIIPKATETKPEQLEILGCPLTDAGISNTLITKEHQLKTTFRPLELLDAHTSLFLLKNALSAQKLNYVLRGAPCYLETQQLDNIDCLFRTTIERITNVKFDDQGWDQATLPVNLGGLGIPSPNDLARPAYLSSLDFSQLLIRMILQLQTESSEITEMEHSRGMMPEQKNRYKTICEDKYERLLNQSNQHRRACLVTGRCESSGAWINALPVDSVGTHLDDDTVRIGISTRLALEICRTHKCRCGATVDCYGHHALSYRRSAGRFPRHKRSTKLSSEPWSLQDTQPYLNRSGLIEEMENVLMGSQFSHLKRGNL